MTAVRHEMRPYGRMGIRGSIHAQDATPGIPDSPADQAPVPGPLGPIALARTGPEGHRAGTSSPTCTRARTA